MLAKSNWKKKIIESTEGHRGRKTKTTVHYALDLGARLRGGD